MKRYAPNALELASRDVVSRSETTEIEEGRGVNGSVLLDLRHLGAEKILTSFPGSRELAMTYAGVDPIYEPIPVRPGRPLPHGRRRDRRLRRAPSSTGLYAAGECACVSVHGANRLGGNSLMETITFGRRSGRAAAECALDRPSDGDAPRPRRADAERWSRTCSRSSSGERPWQIREELGQSMLENFGVFRREDKMEAQVEIIEELRERVRRGVVVEDKGDVFNTDLTQAIELGYLLDIAALHAPGGPRAQGEPRRPLAPVRLPGRATTRTS